VPHAIFDAPACWHAGMHACLLCRAGAGKEKKHKKNKHKKGKKEKAEQVKQPSESD
jgi:hypothetical protein